MSTSAGRAADPESGPRISVIVPTLNRRDDLLAFVPTLVSQTHRPDELVVCDAGTISDLDGEVARLLDGTGIALHYLRSEERGTSLQRNIAIERCTGDVIFSFDDDTLLPPDYVERTLACFALEPADFGGRPIGVVMGCFSHPPPSSGLRPSLYRLFGLTHYTTSDDARLFRSGGVRWSARPSRPIAVPVAYGGATAYRREALEEERFDQYMPGYCLNEDVELAYRIARRWTIVQCPDVVLDHVMSPVARGGEAERLSRYVYALFYFQRKHHRTDPASVAAFAWANIGILAINLGRGLKPGHPPLPEVVRGFAKGYRACVRSLRGHGYE